jgi:arabinofuranosyltransferase
VGAPHHMEYARKVWAARYSGAPALLFGKEGRVAAPAGPGAPSMTASYVVLGLNGSLVPLDGAALDPIGLAYPLAAHSERVGGGRVGHDKRLPAAWLAADRGVPGALPGWVDPAEVAAARRALRCGALAELDSATRGVLTPGRFLRNVAGAWERTAFRFPNDPVRAERELCG